MKKLLLFVCFSALIYGMNAKATDIQSTFQVTANVQSICAITTDSIPDIEFGDVTDDSIDHPGKTVFNVNCTAGTNYTVFLNNGNNADGTQRRMSGPNSDFINYNLCDDIDCTNPWPDGGEAGTGDGTDQSIDVYAKVPQGQGAKAVGNYSDTITVTVTYPVTP